MAPEVVPPAAAGRMTKIKSFSAALSLSIFLGSQALARPQINPTISSPPSAEAGKTLPSSVIQIPPEKLTPYFKSGIACMDAKDHRRALEYFQAAMKEDAANSYSYYFAALCENQLGRTDRSIAYLRYTAKYFPSSQVGQAAKALLSDVDNAEREHNALTAWGGQGNLPKETWIPFNRVGNSMVVNGQVNNKPCQMIFDTGAESCVFPISSLPALSLSVPRIPPNTSIMGVGKAEELPAWYMRVNLKVGQIEKRNFPIIVAAMPVDTPLLGQTFFQDFTYSIDPSGGAISFKRKDAQVKLAASPAFTVDQKGQYVYNVPFRRQGKSIMVKVEVNGKKAEMVFDTGAESTLFNRSQSRDLGINIVPGVNAKLKGVSGSVNAEIGVIRSIKFGPIDRQNISVAVTDKMVEGVSLLGQDFVEGWQYDIDNANDLIKFTRDKTAKN